jgi:predicted lipid carrier protein YhbT
VQPVLDALLQIVLRGHPDCLNRMGEWGDARVLIDPIDLPFAMLLRPKPASPSLQAVDKHAKVNTDAIVRGPLETLIDLAEGRVDGDTLFFSRELIVEGDTEVVLALRNAIDAAQIDIIRDIAKALGPLGSPFGVVAATGSRIVHRLHQDMATLAAALIAPALRQSDAQAFRISELEEEIEFLRRQRHRPTRHPESSHETP